RTERFGLPAADLFVFSQGTMPAVDEQTGRVLLADKGNLALSPDGHGGTLAALRSSGGLTELRGRGIEQIFYLQIDNPLVRICDPKFLGYHRLTDSQATTLAVTKRTPLDKVGNLVEVDRRLRIIEYSEFNKLDPALIDRRDAQGRLLYWAGNTAVHAFELKFLERMAAGAGELPFHIAHKKVPYLNEAGELVQPAENNALKFERFIFDLLPAAERALVVECDERVEFAPVKNAPGSDRDSPETVRAQMIALHTAWLEQAGAKVAPHTPVEISPLFALDETELCRKVAPGQAIDEPTYFRAS
ncbi:MAG: UTP--glucose-1-phosphate uridylyltransferase, partial [Planctomycetaceae bacterium]|nr:UTP--glucose-1-phosphate uridylyltransferase [Planctomycetaceae bacterium]